MTSLGDWILPPVNDWFLGARVDPLRHALVSEARGRVLEIGAGSGLNFAHYDASAEVIAIEPAAAMRTRAMQRLRSRGVSARIDVIDANAEGLPIDAASIDTVVFTFVLCSVRNVAAALAETRRVLKPGGRLLVLEHSRDPDARVARWQERVQPVWGALLAGCQLVRDVPNELQRAGFDVEGVRDEVLPLPRIVRHGVRGACIAAR